jgi:ribonuclease III
MSLKRLSAAIRHEFRDSKLLNAALTHRSFSASNNERLEFLGDAVLNCVVSDALYLRFPMAKEGELSRWRANIVRKESLAEMASQLSLGEFLSLGEGEQKSGGRERPSILADTLEAIFGAVFLDAGFEAAAEVIKPLIVPALNRIATDDAGKDAKTALQEALQARGVDLPRYVLLQTRGAAHEQEFQIECAVPALAIRTTGNGRSRRIAEQQAAAMALKAIKVTKS